jgi:hypothetical protein
MSVAVDCSGYKVIHPIAAMRLQYEFYHKPQVLLQFILSEIRTRGSCLILFVPKILVLLYTEY